MIDENTLVVSAEPAQTIVWSMPGRGTACEPSGYLVRQDVISGKVNDIVDQFGIDKILVVGSMSPFVEKVTQEIKDSLVEKIPIHSQVIQR